MKTTLEIPDGLFAEAKAYARDHNMTFREVVETGLHKVVAEASKPAVPFKLRDMSFGSGGMVKDFTWPELRAIIYEGHGGE